MLIHLIAPAVTTLMIRVKTVQFYNAPAPRLKIDNRRKIAEVAIMGVTNKISRSQAFEHAQRLATTNSGRRLVAMVFWKSPSVAHQSLIGRRSISPNSLALKSGNLAAIYWCSVGDCLTIDRRLITCEICLC